MKVLIPNTIEVKDIVLPQKDILFQDCSDDHIYDKPHKPCFTKIEDAQMFNRLVKSYNHKSEVFKVIRLGEPLSQMSWNPSETSCGKVTAVVRFRVNAPICIVSYGFYGPHEPGSHGKYHMEIELLTENFLPIASTRRVTPIIKHSEIFHVKFENPVPILNCTWYHAKFTLLGPPTSQSRKVYSRSIVKCEDYGNLTFRFEMPDSNQLPEIGFKLRL